MYCYIEYKNYFQNAASLNC